MHRGILIKNKNSNCPSKQVSFHSKSTKENYQSILEIDMELDEDPL